MRALTDGEMTAAVGAASALIAAAVAIAAAWLTNRANAKVAAAAREHELRLHHQEVLRSRGEELYTLWQQWLNRLYGYYIVKQSVMVGKISYNDALDLEIKDRDRHDGSHVRIEMLIEVYFPRLRDQYTKVIKMRDEANEILASHRAAYSVGNTDGSKFIKPFQAKTREVNVAAQNLSESLLGILREA
jgi:hypothetical protein